MRELSRGDDRTRARDAWAGLAAAERRELGSAMRFATWNVNSVKQRMPRLLAWLDERARRRHDWCQACRRRSDWTSPSTAAEVR